MTIEIIKGNHVDMAWLTCPFSKCFMEYINNNDHSTQRIGQKNKTKVKMKERKSMKLDTI